MKHRLCIYLLLTLIVNAPIGRAAAAVEVEGSCFRIFDGTSYGGKPDMAAYGIEPITIVYGDREWWQPGVISRDVPPDEYRLRRWVKWEASKSSTTVIDIENWQVTGDAAEIGKTIASFDRLIAQVRAEGRQGPIGIYSILPLRDYWRAIRDPADAEHVQWRSQNDLLKDLVGSVDVLFPSLYTFYDDLEGWKKYATANIAEARRIGAGKPVYVFLWPQYHESNKLLGHTDIDGKFWRAELEHVARLADGVVLWGGWGPKGRLIWKDPEWFAETVDFIRTAGRACHAETAG